MFINLGRTDNSMWSLPKQGQERAFICQVYFCVFQVFMHVGFAFFLLNSFQLF